MNNNRTANIKFDQSIHRLAKIAAARLGIGMTDYIERAVIEQLKKDGMTTELKQDFVVSKRW